MAKLSWILLAFSVSFRFLPFGLVHLALILLLFMFLHDILRYPIFKKSRTITIAILLALYTLIVPMHTEFNSLKHNINFFSSIMSFIIIYFYLQNWSQEKLEILILNIAKLVSVFLAIEFVFRFITRKSLTFYGLKEGGIFYLDSNFVGLVILSLIGLLYSVMLNNNRGIYRKFKNLITIFLVLTFSRAAILSYFILVLVSFVSKHTRLWVKLVLLVLPIILIANVKSQLFNLLMLSGSFRKKMIKLEEIYDYFLGSDIITMMIGNGVNSSTIIFGQYAHSFPLVLINDFGVIGLFLTASLFFTIIADCGFKGFTVVFPYLFASLSVVSYGAQFPFAIFAVGYLYLRKSVV